MKTLIRIGWDYMSSHSGGASTPPDLVSDGDASVSAGPAGGSPTSFRQRERQPTIRDVASLAQVSLPTVSRVLTGAVPVREATRKRVLEAMRELGYRPNGAARALVQGQQPIVGVITRDTTRHGYARMLLNIEARAKLHGYLVAITVVDPEEFDTAGGALDVLLAQPIVGVVVLDYHTYDPVKLQRRLGSIPIATVIHGGESPVDVAHVLVDDYEAARETTRHLLSLGHQTVHHIAVPGQQANQGSHARERGWREALEAAGAPVPAVQRTDWSIASGVAAGAALAADSTVTAVFCSNDELAFATMRSMHEAGRQVPADVSVAGLDDEPLASIWVPSLTTYRLDFDWAGQAALELLIDPAEGAQRAGNPRSGLVVRESTRPPR